MLKIHKKLFIAISETVRSLKAKFQIIMLLEEYVFLFEKYITSG